MKKDKTIIKTIDIEPTWDTLFESHRNMMCHKDKILFDVFKQPCHIASLLRDAQKKGMRFIYNPDGSYEIVEMEMKK